MAQGNAVSGTLFTARLPIFSSNSKNGIFILYAEKRYEVQNGTLPVSFSQSGTPSEYRSDRDIDSHSRELFRACKFRGTGKSSGYRDLRFGSGVSDSLRLPEVDKICCPLNEVFAKRGM